jgi:hypothetical protein
MDSRWWREDLFVGTVANSLVIWSTVVERTFARARWIVISSTVVEWAMLN